MPGVLPGDRERAQAVFAAHAAGATVPSAQAAARAAVTEAVQDRPIVGPQTWAALGTLTGDIATQVREHGEMSAIPAAAVPNVRNDMYLVSEAIRLALKVRPERGSDLGTDRLSRRGGQRDQVHPDMGEGRGGDRARSRHHGRLEAHRGDGGREDRQDAT